MKAKTFQSCLFAVVLSSFLLFPVHTESSLMDGSYLESPTLGTMVLIPSGTMELAQGTTSTQTQGFYMAVYPVTRAQFLEIMEVDPSDPRRSSGMTDPVQQVTWYQAIGFANKLSIHEGLTPVYEIDGVDFSRIRFQSIPTQQSGPWNRVRVNTTANGYRLPTEMEWLWAAGGASPQPRLQGFAGSDGSNNPRDYLWYSANAGGKTQPVGSKLPNQLGIYDLSGNVWEWVWDWYGPLLPGELVDYSGPETGTLRTHKGGAWNFDLTDAALASRDSLFPFYRHSTIGFRLVRTRE